jgi:hypothetical protein
MGRRPLTRNAQKCWHGREAPHKTGPARCPHFARDRELAATLVTRDREMLAYGETGNVSVVAC